MNFRKHSDLEGKHAFLSASKYHWVNYDEAKLTSSYLKFLAVQKGTEMHELAARLIKLGVKLPKNKKTLNRYVNDAIDFGMHPEQPLYFSENCFGTADAISFDEETSTLRIHDLKTGQIKTSMAQLRIYAAIFCLEYGYNPMDLTFLLRIYQYDECKVESPSQAEILKLMEKIVSFDYQIEMIKKEGEK